VKGLLTGTRIQIFLFIGCTLLPPQAAAMNFALDKSLLWYLYCMALNPELQVKSYKKVLAEMPRNVQ